MSYGRSREDELWRLINFLKAHNKHWCPIVSSKEIKKAICNRCDELGVTLAEVCASAEVNYKTVKKFYIDVDEAVSRSNLRAETLMKIGKEIGIKIKVIAIMDKVENIDPKNILKIGFTRG